ncbi:MULTISPECIES: HdeD family acid-resistance protein [Cyanophyceae]|uniref:HdeD family acid-resistance protein n=1 Tax=Cyanophyceae TaxID=3028117 RepID=UPI00232BB174|nr:MULTISPECIES: HdeD family acid-resistance protein [Cyanophyceae]MDB9318721.1 HdeD family acid-resistance protein [Nodularia spumigena CS-590/01A]MDB9321271.1 HdeD family acid-resistance protein [Nodularia spumigena CS-591/07A]MDB9328500.1 HdeD family acid-resistance protein [Nodularia spumigena CS-590/02]MDB9335919.1 HdeD family acid-resistance protein [Nodularia spumigena CS-590/01]MDB9338679.1 HdeD family acid-resistance protein [Nodularia spumigena CS-589/07]
MTNLDPMRMGTRLARNWWTVALRGAIAIIFGLAALFWPDITLTALIFIFAAFVLVSGVLLAIAAFRDGLTHTHGWLMLLEGAIGIAVGIMAFIWPGITALVLLYLIAAWAIVTGVLEIIAAIQIRKEIQNEWLLAIAGIASVLFGVLLLVWPLAGALAILWIIGAYAIIFGILLLILAFRLRSWGTERRIF